MLFLVELSFLKFFFAFWNKDLSLSEKSLLALWGVCYGSTRIPSRVWDESFMALRVIRHGGILPAKAGASLSQWRVSCRPMTDFSQSHDRVMLKFSEIWGFFPPEKYENKNLKNVLEIYSIKKMFPEILLGTCMLNLIVK